MVEKALYDFAEAAIGKNRDMQWSLSASVLRRQMAPVFERCENGDLTAEEALDVAIDFVVASVKNTVDIFGELFQTLEARISEQLPGFTEDALPALTELQEFFLGLNTDSEWATDENITRQELYPLFVRVSLGKIRHGAACSVFCDTIASKRDMYLDLIHGLIVKLTQQIVVLTNEPQGSVTDDD